MVEIGGLFESHLTVSDLARSLKFYGEVLNLPLARHFPDRRVAFFWLGAPGNAMLGLWESGTGPQRLSLHMVSVLAHSRQIARVQPHRNETPIVENVPLGQQHTLVRHIVAAGSSRSEVPAAFQHLVPFLSP
jgi:catechol 2,3-dioxygenase-like lactoylglutathione lyase family enzyme